MADNCCALELGVVRIHHSLGRKEVLQTQSISQDILTMKYVSPVHLFSQKVFLMEEKNTWF